jgi:hypothetical protein
MLFIESLERIYWTSEECDVVDFVATPLEKTGHGVDLVLTTSFEYGCNFGPIDLEGILLEALPAVIDVAGKSAFGQNNKRAALLRRALDPITRLLRIGSLLFRSTPH